MEEIKKPKIFLIEDDSFLVGMYMTKLEKGGFEVEACEDGKRGLTLLLEKEVVPHLVLLDLLLPRVDGFEILKRLKANNNTKDIPVIILTNLGQKQDIEKGLKLGAHDYIIKAHFTPKEVISKIRKALESKESLG